METKKISFGFSKLTQKNNFIQPQPIEETKVELIKCLEGKEIKLVEEPKPIELLVIPMKETGKTSAALASLIKRRSVLNDEPEQEKPDKAECKENNGTVDQDVNKTENLEQRAARELLSEAKSQDDTVVDTKLVLPTLNSDELPLEGAAEPTFDDYESIPVEQFGRALLRGMGWVDPPPEKESTTLPECPMPRPRGMGLGADKAFKTKPLLVPPEKNEVLEIKRKAFVRILGGKHKDMYGQIEDFDDFAGRIIVRMAIGGSMEVFSEFMCQPVAKKEFEQYAKCINAAKYEAYKKLENEYGQIIIKKDDLKSVEITKSDLGKSSKELSVKSEKHERYFEEKYVDKAYERSSHRDRKYKDDYLRTSDSRARSPSDQPCTSSQYYKNLPSSSSRDYKDSKAHTSRNRHRRKSDSGSSDTDSTDSDDAHKRKHKKKSSKSSSRRKQKKSKSRRREFSSGSDEDSSDAEKRHRSHKKKTKKSKRERSRSRSRGRR